jgi:CheY-like chemotaxis protein
MAQGTAGSSGPQPGSLRRVLLVDDNDRYAEAITADLIKRGVEEVVRAVNAKEGIELLRLSGEEFDGVVSDISMEHQISGLKVLRVARKIHKGSAYHDKPLMVACATTGLDTPVGFAINNFLLGKIFRCDYLIPKRPIKRDGKIIWIRGAEIWE